MEVSILVQCHTDNSLYHVRISLIINFIFIFQSEKVLSSEPEVVGEVNNVEFDETEIAVTVEKVVAEELTNDDVKSVDVEVAIEEESTKEVKAGYTLPSLKK